MNVIKITAVSAVAIILAIAAWMLFNDQFNTDNIIEEEIVPITEIEEIAPADNQIPPAVEATQIPETIENPVDPNATIEDDLSEIDAQLKALQDDTAAADAALNDVSEK